MELTRPLLPQIKINIFQTHKYCICVVSNTFGRVNLSGHAAFLLPGRLPSGMSSLEANSLWDCDSGWAGPEVEQEMATAIPDSDVGQFVPSQESVAAAERALVDQISYVDDASEDPGKPLKSSDAVKHLLLSCSSTLARYTAGADADRSALALRKMTKIFIIRRNVLQEDEDKKDFKGKDKEDNTEKQHGQGRQEGQGRQNDKEGQE